MPKRTLRILLVTPAGPGSRHGNRITAGRWAAILRAQGHTVRVATDSANPEADLLVALHARKSHRALVRFRRAHPDRPIVLALTGTDVYCDLPRSETARASVAMADRVVALQPEASARVAPHHRSKLRVIYQSCRPTPEPVRKRPSRYFDVCVVGHLRAVKDPFRAAMAARRLPSASQIRVLHYGAALSNAMKDRALREAAINPRYRWLRDRPQSVVLKRLRSASLLVLSSKAEGGANVLSEAVVADTPILATRIPGSVGVLGQTYPGYFEVGDTAGLTALLLRAETDRAFYRMLREGCRRVRPLFDPAEEIRRWKALLDELRL